MEDFPKWLKQQLEHRDWHQSDLARRAGVDTGSISRVLSGSRQPGPDICRAIADALELPPELVFRRAGLLPLKPGLDELKEKILHHYDRMSPERRRILEQIAAALAEGE